MADPTNTLAEAAPSPPPADKVRMLAPDNVVYSVDAGQAKTYETHGYKRYQGPTIDEGSIEAKFADWRGAGKAAGLGAINQVPFLDAGLGAVAPDTAKDLASATADARAAHPYAYGAGSVAGALGSYAAGGALVKAGAGAVGLASRFPQLAAMAESSPVIAAGLKGAAGSATLDVADQVDNQALEHALAPAGQEKVAFSLGHLALAAGLGAVIPASLGALPAGLGRTSRVVDKWAGNHLVNEFVDAGEQKALLDAGKGHVTDQILRPLVDKGQGSDYVIKELTSATKSLATTQENLLADNAIRDVPMTIDEARDTLTAARGHLRHSPAGLDDLKPLADVVASHDAVGKARKALQTAKRKALELGEDATEKQTAAATRAVMRATKGVNDAKTNLMELPKDKQLKEMAEALYSRIDFKSPIRNEAYPEYLNAGRAVAAGRDTIFKRAAPAEQAQRFALNRQVLSDHLAVTEALGQKHIPDVRLALDKAKSSAAIAGTMAALGIKSGSVAGSAAMGGGMALLYYSGLRGIAAGSRSVAGWLTKADKHLAGVLKAGLYGTSIPRVAMHKYDFQTQASRVRAAQQDPTTSYGNLHAGLIKAGVPEPVADRVAPRLHGMVQSSAMTLPKPQNTPDIASPVQPDLHQQRAWLSEHRSRIDPTYALTFPTKQNMNAAKQHHPETIARAQEAVMDTLAKNPYLPLASRMWASRVLGRPAGGLTSPKFYQSLSQMRAKADAEAQQGGEGGAQGPPSRQRGNGPSPVAQSEQTRMGELSTR